MTQPDWFLLWLLFGLGWTLIGVILTWRRAAKRCGQVQLNQPGDHDVEQSKAMDTEIHLAIDDL